MCIYIYIYIYIYVIYIYIYDASSLARGRGEGPGLPAKHRHVAPHTANLRTRILDFGGFDPSRILILRGAVPRPIGNSRESLSKTILVAIILVGRSFRTMPSRDLHKVGGAPLEQNSPDRSSSTRPYPNRRSASETRPLKSPSGPGRIDEDNNRVSPAFEATQPALTHSQT